MVRKGVLIGLLACLPYLNALNNPFVYDDHDTVVANASLVDLSNVRFLFLYSPFRPLVNLSYAIDRALWGYRPLGFHLTSILLHAAAAVLLLLLLQRILDDGWRPVTAFAEASAVSPEPGRRRKGRPTDRGAPVYGAAAFIGAALFAVHPLQTEAVGYVSGRSEVLCAVWFLGALVLARDAMASGGVARGVMACVCGALAIASKELGVVLPIVVLVYDWLLRPGDDDRRWRRLWRIFIPGFALAAAIAGYRLLTLPHLTGASSAVLTGMTQAIVVWRYVGLLLWPGGQSIMHAVHRVTSPADPLAATAVAGLAGVCMLAFWLRRRAPVVGFGVLWFLIVLSPSSSIVALAEGMAEHRVYLASAGIFIAIAGIAVRAVPQPRRKAALPGKYIAAAAVVITVLSVLTVMRNRIWGSTIALWGEAVVHAEGMWEPHYALADALREAGNCGAAVPEYRKVVALSPAHRDAYVNLGICLAQTGQLEEAERSFRQVLAIDPSFARGYTNLGALALVQGDAESARDFYREAIAQDQNNVLARMQLASLYEHTFGDYHAAARMCGEVRAIAPSTPGVAECVERNQRLAAAKDGGK
jgi:cytochrome c-type biogenesis protein CcmH/NrfG